MLTILCDSNRLDKIAAPRSIKDDCLQNKCLLGGLQGLQRHNILPLIIDDGLCLATRVMVVSEVHSKKTILISLVTTP